MLLSATLNPVAAAGKLWVFKAILDAVENKVRLAELCTRHIVPKAAFVDLLFLFAPRRMTLEAYAPEYFDRMKVHGFPCVLVEGGRCHASPAQIILSSI